MSTANLNKLYSAQPEAPKAAKKGRPELDWINVDLTKLDPQMQEAWQVWHNAAGAFKRLLNEKLDPDDGYQWLVTDRRGGCAIALTKTTGNNVLSLSEIIDRVNSKA